MNLSRNCTNRLGVSDNNRMEPLHAKEIQRLRQLHHTLRDRRQADKIKAVILLGTGWTVAKVAEALLLDEKTIHRYQHAYHRNPNGSFWETDYQGSQCELSEQQLQQLDQHLQQTVYLTVAAVVDYVRKAFGVYYSVQGMTNLLHRLGFVYKKPVLVPGKADAARQEAFIKHYKKLKAKKAPIYFMDGVHPQHNSVAACGWIKKGQTVTLPSNTGRQRLNINGALNPATLEVVMEIAATLNGDTTIALLKKLERKHPEAKVIYVIPDNARYYRSQAVQDYLKGSRIRLEFLPPYSPNLNLIERLWRYFRKRVLHNKYYETFAEFEKACLLFFKKLRSYRPELITLLTEKFHIIGA